MCADERLERRSTDVCCCRGCVSFGCVQMSGLSEELRLCVAAGAGRGLYPESGSGGVSAYHERGDFFQQGLDGAS